MDSVNYEKEVSKRSARSIVGLTALAILLSFINIRLPFISSMFKLDLSVFPELISAIAYGPVAGVITCFVKFFMHITFAPKFLLPDISNFIVDTAFVVFSAIFYSSHMYMVEKRDKKAGKFEREKGIFFGALISSIPALILQFFLTEFLVYPKLEKYYSKSGISYERILSNYTKSVEALRNHFPSLAGKIPDIKGIWMGILTINLPITFIKYLFVAIVTMIIYKYISPFLHYRKGTF